MITRPGFRRLSVCLALWFALVSAGRAQDKLATLKVGDFTYTNVTVTMVTATDIYFTADNGMGNAKLELLEPALQSYFNYDPAKARAAAQVQQDGAQQYLRQVLSAPTHTASAPPPASTNAAAGDDRSPADIQAEIDASENRVRDIVNQPVEGVNPPPGSSVGRFPYWFGGDTVKPDFATADVTNAQEFPYAVFDYVASDLNRAIAFPTSELESNAVLKYFYTDLSVPKKKLTGDEIKEITQLYRLIAKDQAALDALPH